MPARKPVINPKDAVDCIKIGMSDEAMMQKFGITAKGLESLFRKLVQAGEIDQSSLEQRTAVFERGQSVVLAPSTGKPPQKIRVTASDAVQAVRSGSTDLELMERFSLSAKGLAKLFKKLILAGELTQEELDRRAAQTQLFRVAELDELPEPAIQKPRIKAALAVSDIRSGMPDAALMEKYELSAKGLESLFRKLVNAGEIAQVELDQRTLGTQTSHYVDLEELVRPGVAKAKVNGASAAQDVRAGMTDADLMKKYALSPRGVESLFNKLVVSGQMQQAELDRRALISQQSHMAELEEFPEPSAPKIRVKASELVTCIRQSMSDAALMARFNLSADGLDSLLKKLVAAGKIAQAELDSRRSSSDWAEVAFASNASHKRSQPGERAREYEEDAEFELAGPTTWQRIKHFWHWHRKGFSIAGALIVLAILLVPCKAHLKLTQWLRNPLNSQARTTTNADANGKNEVDEINFMLEAINKSPYRKASFSGIADADNLQDCLRNCERQHSSSDPADRGLSSNCRLECISKYGKAVKAIRKQYYESDSYE